MLREWLSPQSIEVFLQKHLGRTPLDRPAVAAGMTSLLDWRVFGHLLELAPPAVLVAPWGELPMVEKPRSLTKARHLLRQGVGVVVRQAEHLAEPFADLGRAIADEIPGEVHVQVLATPAGTQTFGWHFEPHDAFIVQTVGTREYYFRDNTVFARLPLEDAPDFSVIRNETSRLLSTKTLPGDLLYMPRRWWRLLRSLDDALSLAITIAPCNDLVLPAASSCAAAGHESAVAKP